MVRECLVLLGRGAEHFCRVCAEARGVEALERYFIFAIRAARARLRAAV